MVNISISTAPACRVVCNDKPGDVMLELINALRRLRGKGLREEDALVAARDPKLLMRLVPDTSLGGLEGVAQSLVSSSCAECAVNWAYNDADPA